MGMATGKVCKDCVVEYLAAHSAWKAATIAFPEFAGPEPKMAKRSADKPGPRCATHWRRQGKQRKERAHEIRQNRVYKWLDPGDYERLLKYQGGTCAIPRCPAKGVARRLATDHDHRTGDVRGLLCSKHNRLIGENFDDPEVFEAIAAYLRKPTYERMKEEQWSSIQNKS